MSKKGTSRSSRTDLRRVRETKDDDIDPNVGFVITAKPGDQVAEHEPIATIHARNADDVLVARRALIDAIEIVSHGAPRGVPLISHRVSKSGVEQLDTDNA